MLGGDADDGGELGAGRGRRGHNANAHCAGVKSEPHFFCPSLASAFYHSRLRSAGGPTKPKTENGPALNANCKLRLCVTLFLPREPINCARDVFIAMVSETMFADHLQLKKGCLMETGGETREWHVQKVRAPY